MPVEDKPVPTYPIGWLIRTGATDGICKEDWAKPVKTKPKKKPVSPPVQPTYPPIAPILLTQQDRKNALAKKATSFKEACQAVAGFVVFGLAAIGLFHVVDYLL